MVEEAAVIRDEDEWAGIRQILDPGQVAEMTERRGPHEQTAEPVEHAVEGDHAMTGSFAARYSRNRSMVLRARPCRRANISRSARRAI